MILGILLVIAQSLLAIPVKPGLTKTLTLADGTQVTAVRVGDEHGHYWLGQDGNAYQAIPGLGVYQTVDAAQIQQKAALRRSAANQRRMARMPRKVGSVGSISGDKKGIIILVNFTDKSFTASQSDFYNLANTVNYISGNYKGSMYDYFYAQSEGQFRLTFDVVGPYTLSHNCAYYGGNDSDGDDMRPGDMVKEAVQLANNDVNFADYDWDGDGEVDQVYVVYAGKGEADGGSDDTIWPHEWDLSSATGSYITLDGKKINTYACGGEQNGSTGATAGIGTMCHEFSHCLGYPDFYDTDYSGGQGMFEWDLMDSGSYNGNGYRPAGYTSYERWVAGWKTPTELANTQSITDMKALQDSGSDTYIIYNKGNSNEYYLLENRQKKGWDTDLPGAGLLILHVDYNASAWENNTPNDTPSHQRMTWIPADNEYQYTMYQGTKYYTTDGAANDPFPYGNKKSFGRNTTPAATLYNNNSDGTKYLDSSIEDITQNSNGTISFQFNGENNVIPAEPAIVADETLTFRTPVGTPQTKQLEVMSEGLTEDITLTLTDANNVFSLSTNTISKTEEDTYVDVTFSPSAAGTYTGTITLSSAGADPVTVNLTGTIKGSSSDPNTTKFKLVTSVDELEPDMRYIIACGSQAKAAGSLGSQILSSEGVTVNNDVITIGNGVAVFVLDGDQTNGWTFKNESSNEYLYATAEKKLAYSSTANTWTLADGTAGVIMTYGSCGTMLCNVNSPRFTTYTSAPTAAMIQANLYMEYSDGTTPVTKQDVTMSFSSATATATVGGDFTEPTLTTTPNGLTVTYSSSNTDVATVNESTGEVTLVAAGSATITATFAGNDSYNEGSASYTLTVNSSSTPLLYEGLTGYTSNDDASSELAGSSNHFDYNGWTSLSKMYAGGKDNAQSNGGCLKFGTGSANGTMTTSSINLTGSGTLTFYLKKYGSDNGSLSVSVTGATATNTSFSASNSWTLCTTNLTPTGGAGNVTITLTSTKRVYVDEIKLVSSPTTPTKQDVTMSFDPISATATVGQDFTEPTLTTTPDGLYVTYSSGNENIATVNASTGEVAPVAAGTTTITATFAGNDDYNSGSASYTLTVNAAADPNAPGTANNPYTVAQARAAIDAGTGVNGVYATGTVSKIVTAYNSTYGTISYDISTDGLTTSDQLRAYRGKSYNGVNFTSSDDIKVGDVVVVYGNLMLYNNSIYEFSENNQLVSLVRPKQDVTMSFNQSETFAAIGETFTAPTLTTTPSGLTVSYESSNTSVATVDSSTGAVSIAGVGTTTITASFAGNDDYNSGSASYSLTVSKGTVTMSFDPTSATATVGQDFTEPMLSTTPSGLTVTYSSGNTNIATVDASTGDVTPVAAGTTTITASFAGNDSYNGNTASYTLTISEASTPSSQALLYEGLSEYLETGDGNTALTTQSNSLDYDGWDTLTSIYPSGPGYENGGCLKFGTSKVAGSITSSGVSLTGSGTLTFYLKKYGSDTGKLNVSVTNATADVTQFTPSDTWTLCTVNLTGGNGNVIITLETSSKRAYVDEITLTSGSGGSQSANPYYQPADGKKGAALKTAMCGIIYNRVEQTYNGLWTAFNTTDARNGSKVWDMYSNITNYELGGSAQGASTTEEGVSYNREHSFPKSWFGGEVMPMYTDLHHVYPVDGYINQRRSNNPFGETDGETYKSANDFSKLGACTYTGYTGKVFEPADEYKGDFARTYFYMVTCYEEKLNDWYTNYGVNNTGSGQSETRNAVLATLDGSTYPGLTTWQLNMLMEWAKNDPVSEKETNRNNAVYAIQNNRNPFIDYPGLEEYVWGTWTDHTFSYDNYVRPVYKQDVTMAFNPTSASATVGESFAEPTLTTDPAGLTVTYSSSNTSVATVDASGEVALVAAGTTTITATFAGNDMYNGGSASYTLTVSAASTPDPTYVGTGRYVLVTDESTLEAGEKIIIVNADAGQALSTTQNDNNRSATSVTIMNNEIASISGAVQVITLEKDGNNFLFNTGSGYLYAASSSKNWLRTRTTADDNAKASIFISNGDATITFQGSYERNTMRYNPNNNSPIFSCYASDATTGSLPQIYREVFVLENASDNSSLLTENNGRLANVTLADRTLFKDNSWNTLCLPFAVESFTGTPLAGATVMKLNAATSTFVSSTGLLTLNFTTATEIEAGKAYILKWSGGDHISNPVFNHVRISSTAPVATVSSDQLVRFVGTYAPAPLVAGTSANLYMGDDNTLYYPSEDGFYVYPFRAYILVDLAGSNGVRQMQLNFGDDVTTGVSSMDNGEWRMDNCYTLDGRRVNGRLPKGVYIINGKKILK